MTDYEQACQLRRIILARAAEVFVYGHGWDDATCAERLRPLHKNLKEGSWDTKSIGDVSVNPAALTAKQMDDLGFGTWSKTNPMRLIPLWLFPWLPDEVECGCIGDGPYAPVLTKKSEMDNDNRYGCLAYGVMPAQGGGS